MNTELSPAFFKQLYQFEELYQIDDSPSFRVWILVMYPNEKNLPAESLNFLHKILGAVQLKSTDYHISNTAYPADWQDYSQSNPVPYQQVWAFGVPLQTLFKDLNPPLYSPQQQGEIIYLQSDSLEALQQDTQKKASLWKSLKEIIA